MSTDENNKTDVGDDESLFGPVIFSYTRQQAIEDGVLVDLSIWAKDEGFTIPVACTSALWHGWIVPPEKAKSMGQSERGRVHDVLWLLLCAIRRCPKGTDQLHFDVLFQQSPGRSETVRFKVMCGPGDKGEPVLTLLLPSED